jgi:hypothetical protein
MFTDNDARTLKVEALSEDKYLAAVRQSKRHDSAAPAALAVAALDRAKARAAEKGKMDYSKVGRLADKTYELRTVDIKDLWQVLYNTFGVKKNLWQGMGSLFIRACFAPRRSRAALALPFHCTRGVKRGRQQERVAASLHYY